MAEIDRVVDVNINLETTPLSQKGFNIIAIVGSNPTFSERVRYYTDLASLADDLTNGTSDPEYTAASDMFSQNPTVSEVALIREDGGDADMQATLDAAKVESDKWYGLVLATRNETKVKDAGDWALANEKLFFLASSDTDIINDPTTVDTLTTAKLVFSEDLVTSNQIDITINTEVMDSVTYATSHVATMNALVAELETMTIVDSASLDASDTTNRTIIVTTTGASIDVSSAVVTLGASQATITVDYASIPVYFASQSNDRVCPFYHGNASTEYLDGAFSAKILAKQPGSYTGSYQKPVSVTVDDLTPTQLTNASDKKCNVFTEVGGQNITLTSYVSSGEFVDVIVFLDWLKAKIRENVFGLLVRSDKPPYTRAGIVLISNQLESALKEGQTVGGISDFDTDEDGNQIGGYVITLPDFGSISTNDKANRILRNVNFKAWLSGAIHTVVINGTLTV